MKKLLIPICLLFVMNAHGTIEDDGRRDEPTPQEIAKSRACFEELSQNGCVDPGEDHKQFRACLNNVFLSLSQDCQQMMHRLYGAKK